MLSSFPVNQVQGSLPWYVSPHTAGMPLSPEELGELGDFEIGLEKWESVSKAPTARLRLHDLLENAVGTTLGLVTGFTQIVQRLTNIAHSMQFQTAAQTANTAAIPLVAADRLTRRMVSESDADYRSRVTNWNADYRPLRGTYPGYYKLLEQYNYLEPDGWVMYSPFGIRGPADAHPFAPEGETNLPLGGVITDISSVSFVVPEDLKGLPCFWYVHDGEDLLIRYWTGAAWAQPTAETDMNDISTFSDYGWSPNHLVALEDEVAATTGVIHDIGMLVIIQPEHYSRLHEILIRFYVELT